MTSAAPDILTTAKAAAHRAGEYAVAERQKLTGTDVESKSRNDFVTRVDRTAETLIVETIQSRFPEHAILGEEGSKRSGQSDFEWIIDPLDGTTNYIRKIPGFSVSIAIRDARGTLAGVVHDPLREEMFSAMRGKGAWLNDSPIQVRPDSQIATAILGTAFQHKSKHNTPAQLYAFNDIFMNVSDIRRLGSAAIDLCYTACGRFDGYWEMGLSIWDIAAGALIVEEAGGIVTDFSGKPDHLENGNIVAGTSLLHPFIINKLSNHFSGTATNE